MNSDFSDLRFTNSNGDNLDYWIQSKTDSTSAIIWVEVDSLNSGDTEIYMYYNNSSASSISNGEDTFLFFDDFDDGVIDTTKWNEVDNTNNEITESGGTLNFDRSSNDSWTKGVLTQNSFNRANLSFEVDYTWTANNSGYDAIMYGWHDSTNNPSYQYLVYAYYNPGSGSATTVSVNIYEDGANRSGATGNWTLLTNYVIRVRMKSTGGAFYEQSTDDGETWSTSYDSSYSTESNLHPGWAFYSGHHSYDNARVRKWMTNEPTSTFSSEESIYETNGVLTSNVYHVSDETTINYGNLEYTESGNGTLEIRVRTATDSSMSDAIAFAGCNPISNNTDLTDNNCVFDNQQYVQYQVSFQSDGLDTPILSSIKISGTFGTEDPPPDEDNSNTTDNSNNTANQNNTTSNSNNGTDEMNNQNDENDQQTDNTDQQNHETIEDQTKPVTSEIPKSKNLNNLQLLSIASFALFFVSSILFIMLQDSLTYRYSILLSTPKIDKQKLKNPTLKFLHQLVWMQGRYQKILYYMLQFLIFESIVVATVSIILIIIS